MYNNFSKQEIKAFVISLVKNSQGDASTCSYNFN